MFLQAIKALPLPPNLRGRKGAQLCLADFERKSFVVYSKAAVAYEEFEGVPQDVKDKCGIIFALLWSTWSPSTSCIPMKRNQKHFLHSASPQSASGVEWEYYSLSNVKVCVIEGFQLWFLVASGMFCLTAFWVSGMRIPSLPSGGKANTLCSAHKRNRKGCMKNLISSVQHGGF